MVATYKHLEGVIVDHLRSFREALDGNMDIGTAYSV